MTASAGPRAGLPIVYALDGDWWFTQLVDIAEAGKARVIVVGIGNNINRAHDYVPPNTCTGGGGGHAAYLQFIRTELIPFIEANVGGDPARRALLGHSHGVSFIYYALFAEAPGSHPFSAYLASDSSIGCMPATTADLQLDWLRAFVAVVDAGSLTAAAPQVHRSQSALSMQLKKLEDTVGRAVLTRGPRHLELTPTGVELLGYARRMLELHTEARAALKGAALTGRVNLGVPDDYAAAYLTPVLRSFATRHGGVEITLVCEQSTLLIPKLSRGELDLAVVTRDKPNRGTLLFGEPLVWVGASQHEAWRVAKLRSTGVR